MITNKDIRVENGFLIINGDKFPLDGQSPETIMEIVEDNSDTTPTENSTAPITSGGVYTADKAISDTIGDITQTGITGADVAAQLEALDDKTDTQTGTITLNSGWSITSGSDSGVRKVGDIAWLSAYFANANDLTVNTLYQIGTLPEDFIPSKAYTCPIYQKDATAIRGILTIEGKDTAAPGTIHFRSLDGNKYAVYTTVMFPLN